MPNEAELREWWGKFKETLGQNGYNLDLNKKSDCARITILSYDTTGKLINDSIDCTERFAFINEEHRIDDLTDEEIVEKQNNEEPDLLTLESIYNASRNGLLFVRPPQHLQYSSQQVVTRANGEVEIMPDNAHVSKNISDLTRALEATEKKPKFPGVFTYIKSWFGNQRAKTIIRDYNDNKRDYNSGKALLDKADKDDIKFAETLHISNNNYYETIGDDEIMNRFVRLNRVLRNCDYENKYPGIMEVDKKADALIDSISEELIKNAKALDQMSKDLAKTDKKFSVYDWDNIKDPKLKNEVHDKLFDIMANLVIMEGAKFELDHGFNMGTITKDIVDKNYKLLDRTTPEYKAEIEKYKADPVFNGALSHVNSQVFGGLIRAQVPEMAYGEFMQVMKREAKRQELNKIAEDAKLSEEKGEPLPIENNKDVVQDKVNVIE